MSVSASASTDNRAAAASRAAIVSKRSSTSRSVRAFTTIPWRGRKDTRPSGSSCRSASRTGVRLTPSSPQISFSRMRSPGWSFPERRASTRKSWTISLSDLYPTGFRGVIMRFAAQYTDPSRTDPGSTRPGEPRSPSGQDLAHQPAGDGSQRQPEHGVSGRHREVRQRAAATDEWNAVRCARSQPRPDLGPFRNVGHGREPPPRPFKSARARRRSTDRSRAPSSRVPPIRSRAPMGVIARRSSASTMGRRGRQSPRSNVTL